MGIMRSGCCLASSIGCLTVGLLLGGFIVWFFYPQLSEEGYDSDDFRYKTIRWMEHVANFSEKTSQFLSKEAQKEKKRLDSAVDTVRNTAEDAVEVVTE